MLRTIVIVVVVIAVLIIAGCLFVFLNPSESGNAAKFNRSFTAEETELIETRIITEEELKQADGTNGKPAYIAIQGIVYNVSSFQVWEGGKHHQLQAGKELADDFLKSGHGVAYLQKLPVVGRLEKLPQ